MVLSSKSQLYQNSFFHNAFDTIEIPPVMEHAVQEHPSIRQMAFIAGSLAIIKGTDPDALLLHIFPHPIPGVSATDSTVGECPDHPVFLDRSRWERYIFNRT